ncbi:MAG: tRNA preQ1(34) S-adenosylmethionine ribosyltransferase-isomerase QueA, partial [Terriglobales bacterium]
PELLHPGDLLVANQSRVFPARLLGQVATGAAVEILLLSEQDDGTWMALGKPGRKLAPGARIAFGPGLRAEVVAVAERGQRRLRFEAAGAVAEQSQALGHMPLPPSIRRADAAADRDRYQTVYAAGMGSAAAPTAGLHFTEATLERLRARGVLWATLTLHVGLGTFQPVSAAEIEEHLMHEEPFELGEAAAAALNAARRERRRVIAVGTTAARVLETLAPAAGGEYQPARGATRLYLYPGKSFRALDGLLTNFHAPRSSLLMLVAAFAGLEPMRSAYQHALARGYRFLSYGDCMLIADS